jgi:hypothetical protein
MVHQVITPDSGIRVVSINEQQIEQLAIQDFADLVWHIG